MTITVICCWRTHITLTVRTGRLSTKLFRTGVHLFTGMNWVSDVGYAMFPLADGGKEIASLQEVMHMVVTLLVVILSIASLVCLIVNGCRDRRAKDMGVLAGIALFMMMVGALGQGIVPPEYFGVVERFSVFAAVGFNAVLGWHLFNGFSGLDETR